MIAWLKARATERNSKRAMGIVVAGGAYFGFVDPAALLNASTAVAAAGALWLAVDAFLTPTVPPAPPAAPDPLP